MSNFHDFKVSTIEGQPKALKDLDGTAVLVVNVASKCGLTPQYAGLEKLQREFKDQGFTVLGLPCNQFGQQEPGTEAEIKQFCSLNYNVSFPMTAKIDVNGASAHPLYKWLKQETGGADIQWNFEKFLIGRDGRILKRYSPKTVPEDAGLRADIERALA
ncbi:MAG TPA: glutathione peroxidase [Gammaproteobacteria bacterium]|nr:glutathione peroxidase [Gammaproteobacteria bacterium]